MQLSINALNYDQILELLCSDLQNEYKHMIFYTYHAGAVRGINREEYQELFKKEAEGEMQHVLEFTQLILGIIKKLDFETQHKRQPVPVLESIVFEKETNPKKILFEAIKMEEEVVGNYTTRIEQVIASKMSEQDKKYIEIFLEDQIKKSREDVDNFSLMAEEIY